jgi:hypothetical protein
MHNVIVVLFPDARIDGCSFHLGQAWWRNIQRIGLNSEYKNKCGEVGKWLSNFFGLPFLLPEEVADAFVEDIMADTPDNEKCMEFADYVLNNYIEETARFPPQLWACVPSMFRKRTNNGPESFHAQFYAAHPPLYIFVDVLLKQQSVNYTKIRGMDIPAGIRREMREILEYSIDQNQMYNNGEITRLQYLTRMGYKYFARTDL